MMRMRHGCDPLLVGNRSSMPQRIASGLASALRHAGWWLEWHTRPRAGVGARGLDS
jgi:hypothetical protein